MEVGAGSDCSTREGISKKEEVLLFLSNEKKFELSGGRSRELIFGLSRGIGAWRSSREAAELLC